MGLGGTPQFPEHLDSTPLPSLEARWGGHPSPFLEHRRLATLTSFLATERDLSKIHNEINELTYFDLFTADVCIIGRVTDERLVHMDFLLGVRKAQKPDERHSVKESVGLILCKRNTEAWQQLFQGAFLITFLDSLGLSVICFRVRVNLDKSNTIDRAQVIKITDHTPVHDD